jgi:type II secretory pathway component GspD/PulD (secretin)
MRRRDENLQARLLCGAAAAALLMTAAPAMAQTPAPAAKFNIAAQPLADGLNEFAKQSGRPVMFTPEVTGARMTRGAEGVSDPELALNMVLADTGLTWRRSGDTYLIMRATPTRSTAAISTSEARTIANRSVIVDRRSTKPRLLYSAARRPS